MDKNDDLCFTKSKLISWAILDSWYWPSLICWGRWEVAFDKFPRIDALQGGHFCRRIMRFSLGKHLVKRELTDVSNCFELFRPLTRGRYANLNDNHLGLRIPNHPKQPLFQTALYFSLGLELDPQKIWINFCSQAGKRQWHPRPRSISLSSPGALLLPVPGTQISHRSDVFCTPRWRSSQRNHYSRCLSLIFPFRVNHQWD